MNTLVIEKSALKNNISLVKKQAGASYIYANLSGDGYGAGAVPLARLLRDEGIRRFCVDSAQTRRRPAQGRGWWTRKFSCSTPPLTGRCWSSCPT